MAETDDKKNSFLGYVEQHERVWGTQEYPGRPSLFDLINAKVVAFWHPSSEGDKRLSVTVHEDMTDLNTFLARLLLHINEKPPDRRLARIFVGGRKARIKGVRLQLVDADNEEISLTTGTFSAVGLARAAEEASRHMPPPPPPEPPPPLQPYSVHTAPIGGAASSATPPTIDWTPTEDDMSQQDINLPMDSYSPPYTTPDTLVGPPDTGLLTSSIAPELGNSANVNTGSGNSTPNRPRQRPPDAARSGEGRGPRTAPPPLRKPSTELEDPDLDDIFGA
jgi:hypothetical protein